MCSKVSCRDVLASPSPSILGESPLSEPPLPDIGESNYRVWGWTLGELGIAVTLGRWIREESTTNGFVGFLSVQDCLMSSAVSVL